MWPLPTMLLRCCALALGQCAGLACAQSPAIADGQVRYRTAKSMDDSVHAAFDVADGYMDVDRYDTAQLWLNAIYRTYSLRKPTRFNYFLRSRQAEVYYYNSLFQLGLQSALAGLDIARQLNDSMLLADAYNLAGLMAMKQQKQADAVGYLRNGIACIGTQSSTPPELPLSLPHHIWGNLAEVYEQQARFDSADYCYRRSLDFARAARRGRGIAVAQQGIAKVCYLQGKHDRARAYYGLAIWAASASMDYDVVMVSYAGLAQVSLAQHRDGREARAWLDSGFALLREFPDLNALFRQEFYDAALAVYQALGDAGRLTAVQQEYLGFQKERSDRNAYQVAQILQTSIDNETRLLHLQVSEIEQQQRLATTRLYIALMAIALLLTGIVLYRLWWQQRLQVYRMRNRISKDLHDEIGATLSGVALFSQMAQSRLPANAAPEVQDYLGRIADNAREMVDKMGDIVWAVKPQEESLGAILEKLKHYAVGVCTAKGIALEFEVSSLSENVVRDMLLRQNIYLILKEAVNNAVKYSQATILSIHARGQDGKSVVEVMDNGAGFREKEVMAGNGLKNMQARAAEIKAKLEIHTASNQGTHIALLF